MNNVNAVLLSILLDELVTSSDRKQLTLSNNGTMCAVGGRSDNKYFYLIDLVNKLQHKIQSELLGSTYVPCFINGGTDSIALAGFWSDLAEIWDVKERQSVKSLKLSGNVNGCNLKK